MGSSQREDEAHAFPAREYLRVLLTGKEVSFVVLHSLKGEGQEREYGIATIPGATPVSPIEIALRARRGRSRELDRS